MPICWDAKKLVMPSLVETSLGIMKGAYPELATNSDFILGVITREEEKFRSTLRNWSHDP